MSSTQLFSETIEPVSLQTEMEEAYLTYSMSVIVSRALPDVRDGLKPVHRRILYAQSVLGNVWNKPYKKSARVVGDVIGKYHPHGDTAVYDALVRMAQPFSMRLPLADGQGNFGSIDGDRAAAMRYTEVRMAKSADAMLADLDKNTVNFRPNYDGSEMEPEVLPARFPNVLVNGTTGIAVGMATNIPPHNLGEIIDACLLLTDNPHTTQEEINEVVKGPDFPTGGTIMGRKGIISGNASGRGSITLRGDYTIEEKGQRNAIIFNAMPYQVGPGSQVAKIAELVKDNVIEDIAEARDESDRQGVRLVIELKRGANADVVLNQIFKHTNLQSGFSYNMLALDQGMPKLMGVREILQCFLQHREDVITRRTQYELTKARDRAHILAGLATAVANIDEIIRIIRNAPDANTARDQLIAVSWAAGNVRPLIELLGEKMADNDTYTLSVRQAQAILDLRLHRLTGLEREKINAEAEEIQAHIQGLVDILSHRDIMLKVLKDELIEVREQFATPRRTAIVDADTDFSLEDLIQPEDVVVTISSDGYVKRQPMASYRAQRRGGKGRSVANLRDDEQLANMFVANTHDLLFFFTSVGKVYQLKVYELPQANSAQSRGKAFVNLLPLEKNEKVMRVVPIPIDKETWNAAHLLFATRGGMIRRTPLSSFANIRTTGIYGMGLNEGDTLVDVQLCTDMAAHVLISSANGQAVRFEMDKHLRLTASRTALGVRGMAFKHDDQLISMHALTGESTHILSITEKGYGKLSPVEDFPEKGRGTMGVISIKTSARNGKVITSMPVNLADEVMIGTTDGQIIRTKVSGISVMGRNTQGVRLFDVGKSSVSLVTRIKADMLQEDTPANDADMLATAS